ncbi:ATP-binding protein [Streptomyces anulatus]|uniref:ATP-binding protein n=1 Tax=Streptomyces anulatus TaxID=1892 RepID=UPI0038670BDF
MREAHGRCAALRDRAGDQRPASRRPPPGRGFKVHIYLERIENVLRVELHDSGDGEVRPAGGLPGADDEGGRGLLLVAALADAWGVGERNPGKIVWCEFDLS